MKRIFSLILALLFLLPLMTAFPLFASPAPVGSEISAAFYAMPYYVGTAEGTLVITATPAGGDPENLPEAYVLAWGDKNGPLSDYACFAPIPCTGTETVYDTAEATVVPNTADRMLVYPVYDGETSKTPATAYLPIEFFTYDWGEPIDSFIVASDVHINSSNFENYNDHFKALLADAKATMPNASAILFNGDIADWGRETEYQLFRAMLEEADLPFPFYTNYGNHDSREFVSTEKLPPYYTEEEINQDSGALFKQYANATPMEEIYFTWETEEANFIFFASSETHRLHEYLYLTEKNLTWLENALATVTANGKKTFLLYHQPMLNTVSGTFLEEGEDPNEKSFVRKVRLGAEVEANEDLQNILMNYPDVVIFNSHTHFTLTDPNAIKLRDMYPYMVNTASTAYISRGDGVRYNEAQALYVEVYEDKVVVRGRDVLSGKWIPEAQFALDFGMEMAGEMGPVPTPPAEEPPENDPPAKGGCGGALATAALPLCLSAFGAAVILKKKKRA